jgi:hypothetical protein
MLEGAGGMLAERRSCISSVADNTYQTVGVNRAPASILAVNEMQSAFELSRYSITDCWLSDIALLLVTDSVPVP